MMLCIPSYAAESSDTRTYGLISTQSDSSCETVVMTDAVQTVQAIQEDWKEDYYEEMTIHEDSNRIEIDGDTDTFTNTFSVSAADMREAVTSKENLKEFFQEQKDENGEIYEVTEEKNGIYKIQSPYQLKRIVIRSAKVYGDYGAISKYIYKEGNETILTFATEEDTKVAYERIKAAFGQDACYVDTVITVGRLTQSLSSWGGEKTGMYELKQSSADKNLNTSVTVAVIDTGITKKSTVFQNRTILPSSYNFLTGSSNVTDQNGHGTHVAGIIADLTPKNVNLLILKVADGNGISSSLIVNLAMNYAIKQKADVINVSYGFIDTDASTYNFLDDAINLAYGKGIPVCAAAGNTNPYISGRNIQNCYPACNTQTVSVSALAENMKIASYSYYGSGIDFCAPGSHIISAGIENKSAVSGGESYTAMMSGTSQAAPHLSAAMAYIKLLDKNISVQGACLELKKYCTDLGAAGRDSIYGFGCPNLRKLMESSFSYSNWKVADMINAPVGVTCSNSNSGSLIKWKKAKYAQGYYLYRRRNSGSFRKLSTLTASKTQYIDTNVTEGDYAEYYLVAYRSKNGITEISPKSRTLCNAVMKQVPISSVKTLGGRKLRIKRANQRYWNGKKIEIQCATNSSFRNKISKTFKASTLTHQITAKKRGTNFIRVRSYFRWDGKNYYSAWSKVRKVKVR